MKIPLHEASVRLHIHPLNLLIAFRTLGNLDDCWPFVEEDFLETLITMGIGARTREEEKGEIPIHDEKEGEFPVSLQGIRILDKLERKKAWAGKQYSFRTLHCNMLKDIENLEEELEDLVSKKFLLKDGRKENAYSLNPKKTDIINSMLNSTRKNKSF